MNATSRKSESKVVRQRIDLSEIDAGGEINWRAFPMDVRMLPDLMGINLCAVETVRWTRLRDGQLVDLAFEFCPTGDPAWLSVGEESVYKDWYEAFLVGPRDKNARVLTHLWRVRDPMPHASDPIWDDVPVDLHEAEEYGLRDVSAIRWSCMADDGQLIEVAFDFHTETLHDVDGEEVRLRFIQEDTWPCVASPGQVAAFVQDVANKTCDGVAWLSRSHDTATCLSCRAQALVDGP